MKNPRLHKFKNDPSLKGLIIFAQALDELLFDYTLDTFKAPALNFHLSLLETRNQFLQLIQGRVRKASIVHCLNELKHHFETDPVIEETTRAIWRPIIKKITNEKTAHQKAFQLIEALLIDLEQDYWSLLKEKINNSISLPKNKKKIISLARVLTVEIELLNFNRRYLFAQYR